MSTDLEAGRGKEFPRPLTVLEHQVIRAVLIEGLPGVAELRAQLESARVSAQWKPSGSPSIDVDVPADLPTAHVAMLASCSSGFQGTNFFARIRGDSRRGPWVVARARRPASVGRPRRSRYVAL